jgi:hypothetical protein
MSFATLFKVFSKRAAPANPPRKPLTISFRNRVFMRCRDLFSFEQSEFWTDIQSKLAYLHGRPRLANTQTASPVEDVLAFLNTCSDPHFLDFLEYALMTQAYFHASRSGDLVKDLNEFLRHDDLPYAVTDFVWTESVEVRFGTEHATSTLTAYPQVIRKDTEVLYQSAIEPALQVLRDASFAAANKEFLEALEDFRKTDYGDCLTKCGSAFESVLKVICSRKRWPYTANDTASPLLKTVVEMSGLESFFEQPLVLVATLRNRLSKAHGAGLEPRDVTEAKAQYAINATAAAVLLLVAEARL